MQNRVLCRGEVDQLQEVASTNEAHSDDSCSFSQILLGRPSWPHQTHYFAAMQSTNLHQNERLAEFFASHRLVHNNRKIVKIIVSKECDGAFAVVDVDT